MIAGSQHAEPFRAVRWAVIGATLALFLLCIDAQWLKVDDFTMMQEFRATPLATLVGDVLLTRTTPHVRFSFVQHLLLLPFYRGGFDSRAAVNAVYVATVLALLGGGVLLSARLRKAPLAWSAAWAMFLGALLSTKTWNSLEFKAATYLCSAFAALAALVGLTFAIANRDAPSRRQLVAWTALALLCVHTAEVTLVGVAVLGLALVLLRRMRVVHLAAVAAWPLVFWAANVALSPRPPGVVSERTVPSLPAAIPDMARVAWRTARSDVQLAIVVALGVLLVVLWPSGRSRRERAGLAALVLALPASGIALQLLVQTQMPGLTLERYVMYGQLCVAGGAICMIAVWAEVLPRRMAGVLTAILLVSGVVVVRNRLPRFLAYVDARREELQLTFALQRATQAAAADAARAGKEVIVFVRDWRLDSGAGDGLDPTFLLASWSRTSFASRWACPVETNCPRITFVPNAGWLRAPYDAAERAELCRRIAFADVLLLADREEGARRLSGAPADPGECERWIVERQLVHVPESGTAAAAR